MRVKASALWGILNDERQKNKSTHGTNSSEKLKQITILGDALVVTMAKMRYLYYKSATPNHKKIEKIKSWFRF